MYLAHFALKDEPFGITPDGRFFYETAQHREALSTLYYGIKQRRGFMLLLGSAGLGKTSVLVQLLDRLYGEAATAFIPHTYFESGTVLDAVLTSLGLDSTPSRARNHRLFYDYLIRNNRLNKTCVIIFDEAQHLDRETLEDIRMLSNFETRTEKLIQIVLSGQPPLADALRRPDYEQIRQRLGLITRLRPLEGVEVVDYLAHRLRVASASGCKVTPETLFTATALQAVVMASSGVPRNVNTICFNSLSLAFALNLPKVEYDVVQEVLQDMDLGSASALPAAVSSAVGLRTALA
jgi:type II secretory pathway predicted ATPase ExeA